MNFCFYSVCFLCVEQNVHYSNLSCLFAFFKNFIFNFVCIRNVTSLSLVMEEPGTIIAGSDTVCLSLCLKKVSLNSDLPFSSKRSWLLNVLRRLTGGCLRGTLLNIISFWGILCHPINLNKCSFSVLSEKDNLKARK